MSKLLLDSKPLLIITELAETIGLNEAIFVQQLHYWLEINKNPNNHSTISMWEKHKQNDMWWVWNTVEDWKNNDFPFWSTRTIERIIKKLKNENLILVERYNSKKYDKTNWYTLNYEELGRIESEILVSKECKLVQDIKRKREKEERVKREKQALETYTNTHTDKMTVRETRMNTHTDKVADGKRQNGGMDTDNLAEPIPEITSEITSEITTTSEKKNIVVVDKIIDSVSKDKIKEFQIKIQDTIKSKNIISSEAIEQLLTYGEDRINTYIENWDKFKNTNKNSKDGFFIRAVQKKYPIPEIEQKAQINNNCTASNMNNFEQREYTSEDFEKYYYKVEG